jgi:uncharacterized protein
VASRHPAEQVTVPSAQQGWQALTFLHVPSDPAVIATVLPDGLEPDPFDGVAWLGITPFRLHASVLPVLLGPRATYVEVNVRTYVRDRDGTDAVWFLSLELDQPAVVTALRTAAGLPYRWADTGLDVRGSRVRYSADRRAPHRPGSFELEVEVGEPLPPRRRAGDLPRRSVAGVHGPRGTTDGGTGSTTKPGR